MPSVVWRKCRYFNKIRAGYVVRCSAKWPFLGIDVPKSVSSNIGRKLPQMSEIPHGFEPHWYYSTMLKIAHRGASGHAPENTMAAFRLGSGDGREVYRNGFAAYARRENYCDARSDCGSHDEWAGTHFKNVVSGIARTRCGREISERRREIVQGRTRADAGRNFGIRANGVM